MCYVVLARHSGLGFSLAQCGNHKSRRDQAKAEYHRLLNDIPNLEKKLASLKNGQLQRNYELHKEKQEKLEISKAQLNAKIQQARLLRDAWRDNPAQQAQLEGLGAWWNPVDWVKNVVHEATKVVSCDHIEHERADWNRKSLPLTDRVSSLKKEIDIWEEKLSPKNMALQRQAIEKLTLENGNLQGQLNDLNREIEESRKAYNVSKELQRIEAEKLKAQKERDAKNRKTMAVVGVSAAVLFAFILIPEKKTKKVNI